MPSTLVVKINNDSILYKVNFNNYCGICLDIKRKSNLLEVSENIQSLLEKQYKHEEEKLNKIRKELKDYKLEFEKWAEVTYETKNILSELYDSSVVKNIERIKELCEREIVIKKSGCCVRNQLKFFDESIQYSDFKPKLNNFLINGYIEQYEILVKTTNNRIDLINELFDNLISSDKFKNVRGIRFVIYSIEKFKELKLK